MTDPLLFLLQIGVGNLLSQNGASSTSFQHDDGDRQTRRENADFCPWAENETSHRVLRYSATQLCNEAVKRPRAARPPPLWAARFRSLMEPTVTI